MRIHVGNLWVKPIAREQLRAFRTTRLAVGAGSAETFYLLAHANQRVKSAHALRHHRDAVTAQRGKTARVLKFAVIPNLALHLSIRLENAHDRVGKERLARTRRAHNRDDLACVDGKTQAVQRLHALLLRAEKALPLVIHAERNGEILNLKQMVTVLVMRSGRMRMMMVTLGVSMSLVMRRSLLAHPFDSAVRKLGAGINVLHGSLPLRRMRIDELAKPRTSEIEQ